MYTLTLSKERDKFSIAHFTWFQDGSFERLHGHNYYVEASFSSDKLEFGLMFPFQVAKVIINQLCMEWDERVLLPTNSQWVTVTQKEEQIEVNISSPLHQKFYSFPKEDVVLLECNNVSSENLARLFLEKLKSKIIQEKLCVMSASVTITETSGQKISASCQISSG